MKSPEFVVCLEEPIITRIGNHFMILFQRDNCLTGMVTNETKQLCDQFVVLLKSFVERKNIPEWRLPSDPDSRIIEYRGRSIHYSKTRFGIMRELIESGGEPVSFQRIHRVCWGKDMVNGVNRDAIEDAIYHLNRYHSKKGIPRFVSYREERIFFDPDHPKSKTSIERKPQYDTFGSSEIAGQENDET